MPDSNLLATVACRGRALRLLSACWVVSVAVGGIAYGAGSDEAPPYFREAKVEELSGTDVSSLVVSRVHPGSAGDQAGILAGDVVLGFAGWRVYSIGEFMYVDQYLRKRREPFEMIVSRQGRILATELDELPLDDFVGFILVAEDQHWMKLAERLGAKLTPEQHYVLATSSPRLALIAQRWLDEEPERLSDAAWLRDFIRLRLALAEQRWDEVAPIPHQIPLPEFREVVDFWIDVARSNAKGESPPDPEALKVQLDFYCFNYPLPRYAAPPLKDFSTSDEKWRRLLEEHVADPLMQPWGEGSDTTFDKPGDAPNSFEQYLSYVKLSSISPIENGLLPTHWVGLKDEWQRYYSRLEKLREDDPADWALYTYALAQLSFRKDDMELTARLIAELEERSPFLAHRAVGNLRYTMRHVMTGLDERTRFEERFAHLRKPHAPKDDALIQYVVARSPASKHRHDPFIVPPSDDESFYWAGTLRDAIFREEPYDDAYARLLADAASGAAAANPSETLQRMEALLTPRMSVQDLTLIEKVADGSKSKGLFLDSATRVLEQSIIVGEPRQIVPINLVRLQTDRLGTKVGEDNPYARVYRGLREIDWSDREKALREVQALFEKDGVLASVAEISVQLRERGFGDEADAYDEKLERWLNAVTAWYRIEYPDGDTYAYAELGSSFSSHPKLARTMERLLRQLVREDQPPDNALIVTELHRARCLMTLGRVDDAADVLVRVRDLKPYKRSWTRFNIAGRTTSDANEYRRHLIATLLEEPTLSEEKKAALSMEEKSTESEID